MKKNCYLFHSRLSLKDMLKLIFVGIVCASATSAFGQAADPNAIDLSAKMDTIARGIDGAGLINFLDVGFQNQDQWEDFEINYSALNDYAKIRFGGQMIFDSTKNPQINDYASLYGDFDGDGVGDIIAHGGALFFKGKASYPFFEPGSTSQFVTHYKFESFFAVGAIDFDGDHIIDYLASTGDSYLRLFKGGVNFGKSQFMFSDDSVRMPVGGGQGITTGIFGSHLKPMVIWSDGKSTYLLKQTGATLSQDSILLISDSASNGIIVTNLYATDITGDGVTDLIVSDGLNIYIFKGGDNFGTYPLTPQTAFYIIKSPRTTDFTNFGILGADFGIDMFACGDLTGSGIPYLAVSASTDPLFSQMGFTFFYAGGKALDTLFDAIIKFENGGNTVDTLHSINSTGRTVCLINSFQDKQFNLNDLDFLMSRDCENIPHKTNPNMAVSMSQVKDQKITATCFPVLANKFTKLEIISDNFTEARIRAFNMLGQVVAVRKTNLDPGDNTEFFDTTDWTSGTYIMKVETSDKTATVKVIINH